MVRPPQPPSPEPLTEALVSLGQMIGALLAFLGLMIFLTLAAGSHPTSCRGASDTRGSSLLDLDGRGGAEAEARVVPAVLFRAGSARVGGRV